MGLVSVLLTKDMGICIHFKDIVISETYFYLEKAIFQNIKYKPETQLKLLPKRTSNHKSFWDCIPIVYKE